MVRAWLGISSCALALVLSCALVTFERGPGGAGGSGGAASAGGGGSGPDTDTCHHTTFPTPPAGTNLGGTTTFTGAVNHIYLNAAPSGWPNGQQLGLDLDHVCTCYKYAHSVGPGSCKPPSEATANADCDGPNGEDDAIAKLLSNPLLPFNLEQIYNAKLKTGDWGLIVRVADYNGMADDDQVTVTMMSALGFGKANNGMPPKWDGTDVWPVSTTQFKTKNGMPDPANPKYVDPKAYVSSHKLVASVPGTDIDLAGGDGSRISFGLKGGVLVAAIVPQGASFVLSQGMLSSAMGDADMFKALSSYRDDSAKPICNDGAFQYNFLKTAVCGAYDILSEVVVAPTRTCDALSIAIGFETTPAQIGMLIAPPMPTPGCPAAADPANDCCDPPCKGAGGAGGG